MADPLSVASGVARLVSLTIQATQLACKYVAEVSEAGETALQCLCSLLLLREVLARISETEQSEAVASIVTRKSDLISPSDLQRCTHDVESVRQRPKRSSITTAKSSDERRSPGRSRAQSQLS
jgi:hypothetical protein